jgi:hypothetical protein
MEVYRTLMGTLRSMAVVLFVLFVLSLMAYFVIRARETEAARAAPARGLSPTAA